MGKLCPARPACAWRANVLSLVTLSKKSVWKILINELFRAKNCTSRLCTSPLHAEWPLLRSKVYFRKNEFLGGFPLGGRKGGGGGVAVRYCQIQLQKIAGKLRKPPPPSWRVKVICGAIIIHTVSVRWSVGYAMNNLDGVPCIHPSLGIQIYIPLL